MRIAFRIAVVAVVVFLLAGMAEAFDKSACARARPYPVEWRRSWEWTPYPHWACTFPDNTTRDVYWWNRR